MQTIRHLNTLDTRTWVWMAVGAAAIGTLMDWMTGPLWVNFGLHGKTLEFLGHGLFWSAYAVLLMLIPISAFRPENRFYLKGDCGPRAERFAMVVGVNLGIYLLLIVSMVIAFA